MHKVALADALPAFVGNGIQELLPEGVAFEAVQAQTDAELSRVARDADVLIAVRTKVDGGVLALMPDLKFVQQLGVGYDNLDLASLEAAGVPAANNPGFNASTAAEHTLLLILALVRRFPAAYEATRGGRFPTAAFIGANQAHMRELRGETVGLVGFGDIGQAVAARLAGFDARVLYHARHRVDAAIEARFGVEYAGFTELLANSGIVSLHVPLTAETRHMIGAAELAQMRPGALLVNTSRGAVIDEPALRAALVAGQLAGAGLDVVADELTEVHPFADLPQAIVTPHCGGVGGASLQRAMQQAAANIDRFLRGEPVLNLVTSAPAPASVGATSLG